MLIKGDVLLSFTRYNKNFLAVYKVLMLDFNALQLLAVKADRLDKIAFAISLLANHNLVVVGVILRVQMNRYLIKDWRHKRVIGASRA